MDRDDDRWVEAVREHAAVTTWPRLDGALTALRGPPGPIRRHGPTPSSASQLRHGPGSSEYADAARRLAGQDARQRQQAIDHRLNEQFGEGQR